MFGNVFNFYFLIYGLLFLFMAFSLCFCYKKKNEKIATIFCYLFYENKNKKFVW